MNDAGTGGDVAVRVEKLRKTYESGRAVALDELSLEVAVGEFVAICGPSGCGKSTLLNMVTCIDRPDSGSIDVFGKRLTQLDSREADRYRASDVGLIFQLHNLLPHLTAIENVQVPMLGLSLSRRERAERATELLEQVDLSHRLHSLPTTLSGGERQRVAVARALVNRPKLLLADEPTGALDTATGDRLLELFVGMQTRMEVTMIVVTHEQRVAERADRTIRMLDGRVEA